MTHPGICNWCQTMFASVEAYRDHLTCPTQERRRAECLALGHRLAQRWVSGRDGCGYCGTAL